jgi:hypothetical protein
MESESSANRLCAGDRLCAGEVNFADTRSRAAPSEVRFAIPWLYPARLLARYLHKVLAKRQGEPMHDLSALEMNEQFGDFEWEGEDEEQEDEDEGMEFEDEESELEAAGELLSVSSEAELDHFLGGLIRKVAKKVGAQVNGRLGNVLGGTLKSLARKALPMVATAVGGPVGGLVASGGLDTALKAFGLELEGLSQEDQELELARRFVRLAKGTVRRVVRQPLSRNPRNQVLPAVQWAMRRFAPGLLGARGAYRRNHAPYRGGYPSYQVAYPAHGPEPVCPACGTAPVDAAPPDEGNADAAHAPDSAADDPSGTSTEYEIYGGGQSGRWYRRGSKIIIVGA